MSKITKEMLVKAESVLHLANSITYHDITNFELLLEQYEDLENLINDHKIMPHVERYNQATDVFTDMWNISSISKNGKKKHSLISIKCEQFLKINQPVQEQSNKQSNTQKDSNTSNSNSKIRYIIELFALILGCGIFHTIGYNQGANSKEKELYDERESLKSEKIELQKNNSGLNDSISSLNKSLDTLRNVKQLKETLNDSILSLSKKNELYIDSIKRQNKEIDSLQRELRKKTSLYEGFYKMYNQVDDSLNKGLKRRKK